MGTAGSGGWSGGDWEDLLRTADRHVLAPLLYSRLAAHPTGPAGAPVPAEAFGRLRRSYLQSAGRNMHLYRELGKVLGRLRQDGIPAIALKGAHLAEAVYGDIALRPMSDVDLLVCPEDLGRVEEVLPGMGYPPVEFHRDIAEDNNHFAYRSAGKGLIVEVHWAFLPSRQGFSIDMDGVWERSVPAVLAGAQASVLCPEDNLLFLCLHTSKHLFSGGGLRPLYDISRVILHYREEMDWEQVRARAKRWRAERCVYAALTLAGEMFGVFPPGELLNALLPGDLDERFMTSARERIFARGHRTPDGSSLSPNVAHLFGSGRFFDKASLFLERVFVPREVMARMYPAPADSRRIYLYYPARVLDLLLRHGRQGWRLARREEGMRELAEREIEIASLRDWLMSGGPISEDPAGRNPGKAGVGI
ncbi:MAG: nucleotidyltransferase domain-containing protein [Candidatus Methylomirabilia bacterium]